MKRRNQDNDKPKRKFEKFTQQDLEEVKNRYRESRNLDRKFMNRTMNTGTHSPLFDLKLNQQSFNLEKFPAQQKKWKKMNQYLEKK